MILHYQHFASPLGPSAEPLLILHGLYGHSGNWTTHAKALSANFAVYTLDVRNHGQSSHVDSMSLIEMAKDVADTMDAIGLSACHLLGHSMGGKIAMMLALIEPARITRLLVVDIAPVDYSRAPTQELLGLNALDLASIKSRADADTQLNVYVKEKMVRDFLLSNLKRNAENGFYWRFNLPVLTESMNEITGWPEQHTSYAGPVLFIRGETSDYIQAKHEQATLRYFPHAKVKTVAGAGHWVHSEKPEAFIKLTQRFFTQHL